MTIAVDWDLKNQTKPKTTISFSKRYLHCLPCLALALILHTGSVGTQQL